MTSLMGGSKWKCEKYLNKWKINGGKNGLLWWSGKKAVNWCIDQKIIYEIFGSFTAWEIGLMMVVALHGIIGN